MKNNFKETPLKSIESSGHAESVRGRYEDLLRHNPAVLFTCSISPKTVITFISENIAILSGYDQEAFTEHPGFWLKHIHPDDRENVLNDLKQLAVLDHKLVEYRFLFKSGRYHWLRDERRIIKNKGVPPEITGCWIDITKQKKFEIDFEEKKKKLEKTISKRTAGLVIANQKLMAENIDHMQTLEQLRKSEQNLVEAQKYSRIGSWEYNIVTKEVQWSSENYNVLGLDPDKVLPSNEIIWDMLDPQDAEILKSSFYNSLTGENPFDIELKITRPDGQAGWIHCKGDVVLNTSGKPMKVTGTLQNITERKLAEDILKKSEEKYRLAIDAGDISVGTFDLSTNTIETDGKLEAFIGYEQGALGKEVGWTEIVHPDDLVLATDIWSNFLAGNSEQIDTDLRILHKNGSIVWILISAKKTWNKNKRAKKIVGTAKNITSRKLAEEALKKSEEKYQTFFEYSAIPLMEEDFSGVKQYVDRLKASGITDWNKYFDDHPEAVAEIASLVKLINFNQQAMKLVGASAKEEVFGLYQQFFNEETWPVFKEQMVSLASGDLGYTGEICLSDFAGEKKHILINLVVAPDCYDTLDRVLASFIDISERKKLEEKWKESERRFRQLVENQGEGIGIVDLDENFVFSNPAGDRIFGLHTGELTGRNLKEFVPPEDYFLIQQETAKRKKGDNSSYELRIMRSDGEQRYLLITATPQLNNDGIYSGTFGVFRDITMRKQTEAALNESETRYRSLILGSPDIVYSFSDKRGGLFYSPKVEQILGYTAEYLCANPYLWNESVHPEDMVKVNEAISAFQEGGNFDIEYRIKNHEGKWIWLRDRSIRLRKIGDETLIDGLASDITDQKLAAEKIQQIAERYQLATTASNDAIYDFNLLNRECAFNSTYIMKYGSPPETEDPSKWWRSRLHPADLKRIGDSLDNAIMGKGNTWMEECQMLGKDGNWHVIHNRAYIIRDEKSKALRIVGAMTDITERKQTEQNLKLMAEQLRELSLHNEAIREEERANIALNLHDDLGQKLTAMNMELSVLKTELSRTAPALVKKVDTMILSTRATISNLKKISSQLRPSVLDDLGIVEACKWQAKEFSTQYNIKCNTNIHPPDIRVPRDLSVQIFRIVQEALTNIIRHASASESEISLIKEKQSLILKVKDNGNGIAKDKINDPHSFGLLGIRERARSCGGGLLIKGEKGKGTEIIVEIPLKEEVKI